MFSGLTNQVTSWMGAAKGEEGEAPGVDPTQSELAADAGEQSFENVPVGDDPEGAKASRYLLCKRYSNFILQSLAL